MLRWYSAHYIGRRGIHAIRFLNGTVDDNMSRGDEMLTAVDLKALPT